VVGYVYYLLGEYESEMQCFQKSYELWGNVGSDWGQAFPLTKMGLAEDGVKDHTHAMQYHQEALMVFKKKGHLASKAYALSRMSISTYFLEDFAEAL